MTKPAPPPVTRKQKLQAAAMLAIIVGTVYLLIPDREQGRASEYSATWSDDFHPTITQAFIHKGIAECGEYRWKERKGETEWLVECRRGNTALNTYQVFSERNVRGPL